MERTSTETRTIFHEEIDEEKGGYASAQNECRATENTSQTGF